MRMGMMMMMMMMMMVSIDATIEIVDVFLFLHATRHIDIFVIIQVHITFWVILNCMGDSC